MDVALVASLAALALIDSTSFGTLLIPIWLLLHPGPVRPARLLTFLGTVASFYLVVGLGIALGAGAVLPSIAAVLETRVAAWIQLVLGVALFFLSFRIDSSGRRADPAGGRVARWRERVMSTDTGRPGSLVVLALTATALEVSTMLPYLAAIGLITTADLPVAATTAVLAGYCLVMIAPALVLLLVRLVAGRRIEPGLVRVSGWMTNSNAMAWIVGIVGFLLARDAIVRLDLVSWLGP